MATYASNNTVSSHQAQQIPELGGGGESRHVVAGLSKAATSVSKIPTSKTGGGRGNLLDSSQQTYVVNKNQIDFRKNAPSSQAPPALKIKNEPSNVTSTSSYHTITLGKAQDAPKQGNGSLANSSSHAQITGTAKQ